MKLNTSWKIVIIASFFNVLAEYSLRGVNNLVVNQTLLIAIFLNYFFYFACLEYLITRYKLHDITIGWVALFFGLLWQGFGPSVVYIAPQFLSVNWINLVFVNFVWWVPVQTILALYIAKRLVSRDQNEIFLSESKFKRMFILFCMVTLSFSIFLPFFPIAPLGRLIMIALAAAVGLNAKKLIRETLKNHQNISSSRFLDFITVFLIVFFIYSSIVLTKEPLFKHTSFMNMDAIRIGFRIHGGIAVILYMYRFGFQKQIPV